MLHQIFSQLTLHRVHPSNRSLQKFIISPDNTNLFKTSRMWITSNMISTILVCTNLILVSNSTPLIPLLTTTYRILSMFLYLPIVTLALHNKWDLTKTICIPHTKLWILYRLQNRYLHTPYIFISNHLWTLTGINIFKWMLLLKIHNTLLTSTTKDIL